VLEPALLKARPDGNGETNKGVSPSGLSCAELTAIGLQQRMVNVHAAAHAAVMIDAFLKGAISYFDVRFNIDPPSVSRKDITASNLGMWLGKAVKLGENTQN